MKPSFKRLGGLIFPSAYACRNPGETFWPHPFLPRRSSKTDNPSDSQRGTLLLVAPRVKVCASSCQAVDAQLNGPASLAAGESKATVFPKLTPSAPRPASPTVRTEKSAWLRYTSMRIGLAGEKP